MTRDTDKHGSTERWHRLNAFVDGELDATDARRTVREIADDPKLAEQAAALSDMKAALAHAMPDHAPIVPECPPAPTEKPRRLPAGAIAAILILAAILTGMWELTPAPSRSVVQQPEAQPAWLASAIDQHEVLSKLPAHASKTVLAGLSRTDREFVPFMPDLTSGRLTVGRAERFTGPDGASAIAVNYRGTRGCRITLVAFADGANSLPEALTEITLGKPEAAGRTFAWRVGGVRYVMIASAMDTIRLNLIAETVHRASQLHRPIGPDGRAQMAAARQRSAPCQA